MAEVINTDCGRLVSLYEMLTSQQDMIHKICIPKIQRDYAQGREGLESLRSRFLSSIFDTIDKDDNGELILDFVFGQKETKTKVTFYPVDGQQRLTTLFLLHLYIGKRAGQDTKFLRKFSYETRTSSAQFCKRLNDIDPKNLKGVRKFIENEWWYTGLWRIEPTIKSMLNMLEDIDSHYCSLFDQKEMNEDELRNCFAEVWTRLVKNVKFWQLDLLDLQTTDELYIKMNSRGKLLTDFEHFKAMLDEYAHMGGRLSAKIDTRWTNLLWRYRDEKLDFKSDKYTDNGLDSCFTNLLIFFLNIEGCKRGLTDFGYQETDIIDLAEHVLGFNPEDKDKENKTEHELCYMRMRKAVEARQILKRFERILDFFSKTDVHGNYINDPKTFFGKYILSEYDVWPDSLHLLIVPPDVKVRINGVETTDLLHEVCKNGKLKNIPTLYVEAFFEYASSPINPADFKDRFRVLRNLLENTEIHTRSFKETLQVVDHLIATGSHTLNGVSDEINKTQKAQEDFKKVWMQNNPSDANLLKMVENHWLTEGNLNVVMNRNSAGQWVDINKMALEHFGLLFNSTCDYMTAELALLSEGDYAPMPKRNGVKAYGGDEWKRWRSDLAKSFNTATPTVLQKFLSNHGTCYNEAYLQNVIQQRKYMPLEVYIWPDYLMRYMDWFSSRYAKYRYLGGKYSYTMLNANGGGGNEYCWNPYNLAIEAMLKPEKIDCVTDCYGGQLHLKDKDIYMDVQESGIKFTYPDGTEFIHVIPQNENGEDVVDRIIYGAGACRRIFNTYVKKDANEAEHGKKESETVAE